MIWIMTALLVFGIPSVLLWLILRWEKIGPRRCQFCCVMISRESAFLGVLNCRDCVQFMRTHRYPRCKVTGAEHVGHSGP